MALSKINADSVSGLQETLTATTTVPSEGGAVTTNVVQGLAKTWSNLNGTGTIALSDSFSVSSISDYSTGHYTINITNNMSNANYSVVFGSGLSADDYIVMIDAGSTPSTSSYRMSGRRVGGTIDCEWVCSELNGDLA